MKCVVCGSENVVVKEALSDPFGGTEDDLIHCNDCGEEWFAKKESE